MTYRPGSELNCDLWLGCLWSMHKPGADQYLNQKALHVKSFSNGLLCEAHDKWIVWAGRRGGGKKKISKKPQNEKIGLKGVKIKDAEVLCNFF